MLAAQRMPSHSTPASPNRTNILDHHPSPLPTGSSEALSVAFRLTYEPWSIDWHSLSNDEPMLRSISFMAETYAQPILLESLVHNIWRHSLLHDRPFVGYTLFAVQQALSGHDLPEVVSSSRSRHSFGDPYHHLYWDWYGAKMVNMPVWCREALERHNPLALADLAYELDGERATHGYPSCGRPGRWEGEGLRDCDDDDFGEGGGDLDEGTCEYDPFERGYQYKYHASRL